MPYLLVHHRVRDYAKWKPVFDEHGRARRTAGSGGGYLLRTADDPNDLVILLEWDTLPNARKFAESEDLRETMARAGVVARPDLYFLEEIERISV